MLDEDEYRRYMNEAARKTQEQIKLDKIQRIQDEKERDRLVSEQQEQRRLFDQQVEKNRLKKQKDTEAQNRRFAAGQTRQSAPTTARKANIAPAKQKANAGTGETPARAFERIFAPLYIPPAIRDQRPDLVEKYAKSEPKPKVAQATRSKSPMPAVTTSKSAAVKEMETQRRLFDQQVEANRLAKQKALEAANRGEKKRAVSPPRRASTPPRKANIAQQAPAKAKASGTSGETPAQAFERIFAPIYIPPAIKDQRPELVEKYQASAPAKTSAGVTKPTKSAPRVVAKPRVTKSAARNPSKTGGTIQKSKPSSPRGVVRPARVTKRASTTTRGVVKPARVTKKVGKTTNKGSPSESSSTIFDKLFGKK
jgi:hypothetical protein